MKEMKQSISFLFMIKLSGIVGIILSEGRIFTWRETWPRCWVLNRRLLKFIKNPSTPFSDLTYSLLNLYGRLFQTLPPPLPSIIRVYSKITKTMYSRFWRRFWCSVCDDSAYALSNEIGDDFGGKIRDEIFNLLVNLGLILTMILVMQLAMK